MTDKIFGHAQSRLQSYNPDWPEFGRKVCRLVSSSKSWRTKNVL